MRTAIESFSPAALVRQFDVRGAFVDARAIKSGHIHDTLCVRMRQGNGIVRYIVQRVNHHVFTNPTAVMENIARVTAHLRAKAATAPERAFEKVLTIVPTRDHELCWQDAEENWWRMYEYVEGAYTLDSAPSEEHAYAAAAAFGRFQAMLADLPAPRLHDTIPDFHHTAKRYHALHRAAETDLHNRAVRCTPELAFAAQREAMTHVLLDMAARGEIAERATHNDTKINNVMFDERTGRGVCVIDLDTVMPGLPLYDFGDCVRTTATRAAEDERDLSKVQMEPELFRALVQGYLSETRGLLNEREITLLGFAGRLISFEIGIRFLTDYLNGDVYFKTSRPEHNLERARAQFALVASMEAQEMTMNAVIRNAM